METKRKTYTEVIEEMIQDQVKQGANPQIIQTMLLIAIAMCVGKILQRLIERQ